jgi:hypothetical protein
VQQEYQGGSVRRIVRDDRLKREATFKRRAKREAYGDSTERCPADTW